LVLLAGVSGAPGAERTATTPEHQPLPAGQQAFMDLPDSAIIEQAIGIADISFGPDPSGVSETLHFTGPVKVQKWPMPGYSKKVLPDGRVQIQAEIVDREKGMLLARCASSFQAKSPVTITVAPGYPWQPGEPGAEPGKDQKQPKPAPKLRARNPDRKRRAEIESAGRRISQTRKPSKAKSKATAKAKPTAKKPVRKRR